jgi:lipoate-protein ligase A
MKPRLLLTTDSFPHHPGLDIAVSRALLTRAAEDRLPEAFRLNRPGPIVAFGKQDVVDPRYADAVAAARARSFEAGERLAGGRAAVFHENTVAFAYTVPDKNPAARTFARFELAVELIATALRRLGVDARPGEVPGEYCPGAYSVNAGGRTKLAGIGQRIVARAAHVGGVVVIRESDRVRDVLVPVYEALALDWDPRTVGSVEDEIGPVSWEDARDAMVAELEDRFELTHGSLDPETLALAERLAPEHVARGAVSSPENRGR